MTSRTRYIRGFLGIFGGASLGYIFARDVSGWFFTNPLAMLLMEVIGAIAMFRIVNGLMEDEKISRPFKRGFIWALSGLISAHVISLAYIYLKDLKASFDVEPIDFSETLAMSWAYMHFTMIGFVLGALSEYASQFIKNRREKIISFESQNASTHIKQDM